MVLEDYLKRHAEHHPDKIAVVDSEGSYTYLWLYEQVKMRAQTRQAGKVIPFRTQQSVDFLIEYFAIHLAKSVAVPLEEGLSDTLFAALRSKLSACNVPEDVADVLYTTGTTGVSKGVMVTSSTILANADNLIQSQGYSENTVFIITGPLNHFGSLSKVFPIIVKGGTLLLLNGMKDIQQFFHALDYPSRFLATFLVPSAIRMLLLMGKKQLKEYAPKIDFIETGAAPITLSDMKGLQEALPTTRLYNTYASTEAGIVATLGYNSSETYLEGEVGREMPHTHFRLTDEGTVVCFGETIMKGYINDAELTQKVLRSGELFTSDRGEVLANGSLRLLGREGNVINVGGYKMNPEEVESVAMSLPMVKDCICIPVKHPVLGFAPKLLVVLKDGEILDKKALAQHLAKHLEAYKVPLFYEVVDGIHHTYNGKLDRKAYQR